MKRRLRPIARPVPPPAAGEMCPDCGSRRTACDVGSAFDGGESYEVWRCAACHAVFHVMRGPRPT